MEDKSQFAGFWKRFVAHIIDSCILSVVMLVLLLPFMLGLQMFLSMLHFDITVREWVRSIVVFVVAMPMYVAYFAIFEASKAQATPGKMAMGLVVTNDQGQPLGIGRAVARQCGRVISGLFFNLGYIICGFTPRRQCAHDLIASTLVVKKDAPLRLAAGPATLTLPTL